MFEIVTEVNKEEKGAIIKIVGVGSGGVNAVNTMINQGVDGVEYIGANTDFQHLNSCLADIRLELNGPTRGRGAGGDPAKGREAAIQERDKIESYIKGADMVLLTTGLGGGTGTGATPVFAEVARENNILTVAVVTLPFSWEGTTKQNRALEGLDTLKSIVDAYTYIPNDKLKKVAPKGLPTKESFQMIDHFLCDAMAGLVELISRAGYINRDFEDVRAVLQGCGMCMIGTGVASGENRAADAVHKALYNPLIEDTPVEGARKVLVQVVQGPDGTPEENELVMAKINECLSSDGDVSFGLAFDDNLGESMKVTIVASGIGDIEVVEPRISLEEEEELIQDVPIEVHPVTREPASRPTLSDQAGLDRVRASHTKGFSMNESQVPFSASMDGESELDPVPAFLRMKSQPRTED